MLTGTSIAAAGGATRRPAKPTGSVCDVSSVASEAPVCVCEACDCDCRRGSWLVGTRDRSMAPPGAATNPSAMKPGVRPAGG